MFARRIRLKQVTKLFKAAIRWRQMVELVECKLCCMILVLITFSGIFAVAAESM